MTLEPAQKIPSAFLLPMDNIPSPWLYFFPILKFKLEVYAKYQVQYLAKSQADLYC